MLSICQASCRTWIIMSPSASETHSRVVSAPLLRHLLSTVFSLPCLSLGFFTGSTVFELALSLDFSCWVNCGVGAPAYLGQEAQGFRCLGINAGESRIREGLRGQGVHVKRSRSEIKELIICNHQDGSKRIWAWKYSSTNLIQGTGVYMAQVSPLLFQSSHYTPSLLQKAH